MAIELFPTVFEQNIYNHPLSFIQKISQEDIPLCGTFMLVDQLLDQRMKIDFAAKLLNSSTTITIHPPESANPKKFMETIILEAELTSAHQTPLGDSAYQLKQCVEQLRNMVDLNIEFFKEAIEEFCVRWQEFTRLVLKNRIDRLLA